MVLSYSLLIYIFQAWPGYRGNVYFEPILVNPARYSSPEKLKPETSNCSDKLQKIMHKRTLLTSRCMRAPPGRASDKQKPSHPVTPNTSNSVPNDKDSKRPVYLLEETTDMAPDNHRINDNIKWINGQERAGALNLNLSKSPQRLVTKNSGVRRREYDTKKIRRGSVFHKGMHQKQTPTFKLLGGKFVQHTIAATPILRSSTQFTQSTSRMSMNSPDPYYCNQDTLPHIERLRSNGRHIDNTSIHKTESRVIHVIPTLERIRLGDTH